MAFRLVSPAFKCSKILFFQRLEVMAVYFLNEKTVFRYRVHLNPEIKKFLTIIYRILSILFLNLRT